MPEQMIDLHCHILPNLDDGPETMEETLVMCGMAFQDGIRTLVAVPHTLNGVYFNNVESILEGVQSLIWKRPAWRWRFFLVPMSMRIRRSSE
jgi:tyrosine-protein phosphatase YwqE